MNALDENMEMNLPDPSEVSFLNTSLKYGLIGGGIVMAWTLLAGILGLNQATTSAAILGTVVPIIIYAGVATSAIKTHRDEELGGYISMGRAFVTAIVACLITALIGGVTAYIYYNFIDPAALDQIIETSAEMMESFGMTEEQVEEAIEQTRAGFSLPRILLSSLIGGGIFGAIVSGITGAVMKKEMPMV